jgi:hypothetical protein
VSLRHIGSALQNGLGTQVPKPLQLPFKPPAEHAVPTAALATTHSSLAQTEWRHVLSLAKNPAQSAATRQSST